MYRRLKIKKICPKCKKEFRPHHKKQIFCSTACWNSVTKFKGGLPHCLVCGRKLSRYDCRHCKKHAPKRPILRIKRKCLNCGEEFFTIPAEVRKGGGRFCSIKCAKGEKFNPNWRGGISKEPYPFNFNDRLKELIRERDDYKCQLCGVPQVECMEKLHIHHIDHDKDNLNPNNLMAFCRRCHTKVNRNPELVSIPLG